MTVVRKNHGRSGRSPDRMRDDIVVECSDLTWNHVCLAIDRFNRKGVFTLMPE